MPRRGDPERIYQAQRAGILARLTQQERVNPQAAERWVVAWEGHAEEIGLYRAVVGFWDLGWEWIASSRGEGGKAT
jgi:hypothetical protein